MLIAYIDESYDSRTRVGYFMAAVLVREQTLADYWQALLGAADPLPRGTELHAVDLFGGDGDFRDLLPHERIGIFRRGLRTIPQHTAGVAVSSRRKLRPDEEPDITAWRLATLEALIPLLEGVAREQNEYLLLVCDEEHSTTTQVVEMLRRGRSHVGVFGTPIIETAMFARSSDSPGVWPADLVAFVERRLDLNYDEGDARRIALLRSFRRTYEPRLIGRIEVGAVLPIKP